MLHEPGEIVIDYFFYHFARSLFLLIRYMTQILEIEEVGAKYVIK